jgi:hypothetical protein
MKISFKGMMPKKHGEFEPFSSVRSFEMVRCEAIWVIECLQMLFPGVSKLTLLENRGEWFRSNAKGHLHKFLSFSNLESLRICENLIQPLKKGCIFHYLLEINKSLSQVYIHDAQIQGNGNPVVQKLPKTGFSSSHINDIYMPEHYANQSHFPPLVKVHIGDLPTIDEYLLE